jgi:hypothetical protein
MSRKHRALWIAVALCLLAVGLAAWLSFLRNEGPPRAARASTGGTSALARAEEASAAIG